MRKSTIGTDFYRLTVFLLVLGVTRTILESVHGAITKETINLIRTLVTGIIFAFFILKKLR